MRGDSQTNRRIGRKDNPAGRRHSSASCRRRGLNQLAVVVSQLAPDAAFFVWAKIRTQFAVDLHVAALCVGRILKLKVNGCLPPLIGARAVTDHKSPAKRWSAAFRRNLRPRS